MTLLLLLDGAATGSLAVTEANDALVATATVLVGASLAATESGDTLAATATVLVGGVLAATEADDSLVGVAAVIVAGALSSTESADTLSSVGAVLIAASAALAEADDALVAAGLLGPAPIGPSSRPILLTPQPNDVVDYLFAFGSSGLAQNDPVVGPYYSAEYGLTANLIIIDLQSGSSLSGFWLMISKPAPLDVALVNHPNMQLAIDRTAQWNHTPAIVARDCTAQAAAQFQILFSGGGVHTGAGVR